MKVAATPVERQSPRHASKQDQKKKKKYPYTSICFKDEATLNFFPDFSPHWFPINIKNGIGLAISLTPSPLLTFKTSQTSIYIMDGEPLTTLPSPFTSPVIHLLLNTNGTSPNLLSMFLESPSQRRHTCIRRVTIITPARLASS